MDTLGLSTQYKVRHCSQCQGDTEFYCHTCKHDMCLLCKERHVIDQHTKRHDLVIYREKINYIPRQQICARHPDGIYDCVKLMSTPVLHASVYVADVNRVVHISGLTSELVWVSDYINLILTDTTGKTVHRVTDGSPWYGVGKHTVNSSGELIYIDSNDNINKLSIDSKTVITLLERPTSPWRPDCVYCSPSTGDLMVGMYNTDTKTGKINRYNCTGRTVLTIQHDNTGHMMYSQPIYITENKNGDIIVSDWLRRAVVVTERGRRLRFSYTGPPSGSSLSPEGICTDALLHILVCDANTHTVQMIDKDGHFLSLLLTPKQHGIYRPRGLNYDDETHLLWVGSYHTNTVSVYRYIQKRYSLTANCIAKDPNLHIKDTLGLSTQYKVRHCSQCQGDTEFYCYTCNYDLCLLCKDRHVIDLHTKYHNIVIYREKFNYIPRQEVCVRHPDSICEMFCQSCEFSVCFQCLEHQKHQILDIRTAYQTKRRQHREIIDNIRSETLYNCRVLLAGIQTDIQTCPPQICHCQSQLMSTKAQRLKDLIDTVVCDTTTRYRGLLIARIQQQKRKMNRRLTHLQNYEDRYEQSANGVVQFLLFIKTSRIPQIKDTHNHLQHLLLTLTEGFNMEDVSQLLRGNPEIQLSTGKRQVGIDECVELTSTPVLHASVSVEDVSRVVHISGVTSERVWVSDLHNLILADTTGDTIHRVTDGAPWFGVGKHTVKSSGELIYINSNDSITKLSIDSKTVTTLLEKPTSSLKPDCVYCSPSTGDLMVGMYDTHTRTGKITRYNSIGRHILTIQHDNTGDMLYSQPTYITENKNGDIIVSDWLRRAVVVTERGGRHRFSYTGPPSGSSLSPEGICSDALSHILVCDANTHTVQMIDKDGHFLSLLLTPKQHGIYRPRCLNYDDETHLLWVGSYHTNTLSVYRYIQRRYSLTDNPKGNERITEASSYEEVQESGTELETNEESESKETSEDLESDENSEYLCRKSWTLYLFLLVIIAIYAYCILL